jgi:hypothetical protein
VASFSTSFLPSVSSGTCHSIVHMIPHGTTLAVKVSCKSDAVLPLFLALIPSNVHYRPLVMHLH